MTKRPQEIAASFERLVDEHLNDLVNQKADGMHDIEEFANLLNLHPTYLSNLIKEVTGKSPCGVYQEKILEVAKYEIATSGNTIKNIALMLDFEPSQFTKWFRRFSGVTPKIYRKNQFLKS